MINIKRKIYFKIHSVFNSSKLRNKIYIILVDFPNVFKQNYYNIEIMVF